MPACVLVFAPRLELICAARVSLCCVASELVLVCALLVLLISEASEWKPASGASPLAPYAVCFVGLVSVSLFGDVPEFPSQLEKQGWAGGSDLQSLLA